MSKCHMSDNYYIKNNTIVQLYAFKFIIFQINLIINQSIFDTRIMHAMLHTLYTVYMHLCKCVHTSHSLESSEKNDF